MDIADNVEDILEKKIHNFICFWSFCILITGFDLNSNIPMIGASGAIAGVLGAYLRLFPRAKVLVLFPFIIFFTFRIPASILLIIWFFFQFLNLSNQGSNVAWIAHIGGFLFGFIYSILFESSHRIMKKKEGKSIFLNKKGPWD